VNKQRTFIHAKHGDTIESIAARLWPGEDETEAVHRLRAWNPHLLAGRMLDAPTAAALLGSNIVFLDPPLP
jgi:hypothetical protein